MEEAGWVNMECIHMAQDRDQHWTGTEESFGSIKGRGKFPKLILTS
jgi:hypothetical protein